MAKPAALAVTLLLYSPSALAWDGLGHEALCELAFRELDDTARQRVIALIRRDPQFTTFRASCNWPDRPRQRAPEHSVNLPRDATGLDDDHCPLADECVVSAIEHDFALLASPDATDEEKLAALKFVRKLAGRAPPGSPAPPARRRRNADRSCQENYKSSPSRKNTSTHPIVKYSPAFLAGEKYISLISSVSLKKKWS